MNSIKILNCFTRSILLSQPFVRRNIFTSTTASCIHHLILCNNMSSERKVLQKLTLSHAPHSSSTFRCHSLSTLCSSLGQGFAERFLQTIEDTRSILTPNSVLNQSHPRRSVVQFSFLNGKRKTVKAVVKRFYRLHWGIWIRPRSGRHKKLWKKNNARKKRARQHVFCSATQTYMLDKMVAKFWRKKTYYVDDPYESYHKRDSFWMTSKR